MWLRSLRGSSPILIAVALCVFATAVAAQEMKPAANVLLPYFEVRLPGDDAGTAVATTVAIANASAVPTEVEITVYTNWGIPVLRFTDTLRRAQPRAIDLEEWIGHGRLPGRTLTAGELEELHAALTGRPSPADHLYRGTADDDGLAVGYLIARATGERREVLWGDTYGIDAASDSFRGDTLATVNDLLEADCSRHAVRFINRDSLYEGTELILWTGRTFEPSPTTEPIGPKVKVVGGIYDDEGNHIADCMRDVVAVQVIEACSMPNLPASGWIDIAVDQPAFVEQHLHAVTAASAELHAWCLPEDVSFKEATGAISLDKYVNHLDADRSPGAVVKAGEALHFTYSVWNSGSLPLRDIVVTDSEGLAVSCPATTLDPGKWMECTTTTIKALACVHKTSATVVATTSTGGEVTDTDAAWYKGGYELVDLTFEFTVNGLPYTSAPGPDVAEGAPVSYRVTMTNPGVTPVDVQVEVRAGPAVSCPASRLAGGASMTCTSETVTAARGGGHNWLYITWETPCGDRSAAHRTVYYHVPSPSIMLWTQIGGMNADSADAAVRLDIGAPLDVRYVVRNNGDYPLDNVTVSGPTPITCPDSVLAPDDMMFCFGPAQTASGGAQVISATASAVAPGGETVTDTDVAHYYGETHPAMRLTLSVTREGALIGMGASNPAHPLKVSAGSALEIDYFVSNDGDVALNDVEIRDNGELICTIPVINVGPILGHCTTSIFALAGAQARNATASAMPAAGVATPFTAPASLYYVGLTAPSITIDLFIDFHDADTEQYAVTKHEGQTVSFEYWVINTGGVALGSIVVTDSEGLTPACPVNLLGPGQMMRCTASKTVVLGSYSHVGVVTAQTLADPVTSVIDSDPVFYKVVPHD